MSQAARKIPTDPEGFIAWENRQGARYELIGDLVRMMSSGTLGHDLASLNTAAALRALLRGSDCFVHGSNLKVRCTSGSVVYPDAFVRCGPADPGRTEIDDPVLVVEVDSPSTKRYDMNVKRWAYQSIPSLRHILFIAPTRYLVELVTRQDDERWLTTLIRDPGASITMEAFGIELPMSEIYAGIEVSARLRR